MHTHTLSRLCRSASLTVCFLTLGLFLPPSLHAFEVADGMALLRQTMPANYCALTFDDGPGPYTAQLLDVLAQRGVVATFFVLGQQAERRPALVKRMLAEGHEVAGHSWSHPNMRRLTHDAQRLELRKTSDLLAALGADIRYFRPPYGRYNADTRAAADSLGLTIMLWSLDSQDWKRRASRLEGLRSVSPTVQQSFPGMRGVLLFHDTHRHTIDEMPDIIDALTAAGCERFVTVSEYAARAPVEEERRLSTHAPNEGRGETPPPPGESPLPDKNLPNTKPPERDPETRAEKAPPHAAAGAPLPGIRTMPLARSNGASVPLVPPSAGNAMPGGIPPLLSRPELLLPIHKQNGGGMEIRQADNSGNPG